MNPIALLTTKRDEAESAMLRLDAELEAMREMWKQSEAAYGKLHEQRKMAEAEYRAFYEVLKTLEMASFRRA
jgi:hypothetical protein